MFRTLVNAFKIKDIRKRLFYTILALLIVRLGSQLPVPGTDTDFFKQWFASQSGDAFNFFDAFTGGSFTSMSVFALGITPYIMASIIIQMLTLSIPALEEMSREEDGRTKLNEITRYAAVGLALVEGIGMAVGFGKDGLLAKYDALNIISVSVALTALFRKKGKLVATDTEYMDDIIPNTPTAFQIDLMTGVPTYDSVEVMVQEW